MSSKLFFEPLTGLRAPLTIWVVHHNFFFARWFAEPGVARSILGNGFISVSIFFQLSGFLGIITGSRERSKRALLLKRCRRLYPAFWISVALGVASEHLAGRGRPWDLNTCSSLLIVLAAFHAWLPDLILDDAYNGPSWSVSCEVFFSAALVSARPLLNKVSGLRAGLAFVSLLMLLLLATALVFRALGMHNSRVKFNPLVRLPQFLAGSVLGRMRALGFLDPLAPYAHALAALPALALFLAASLAPPFALNPLYPFYISGLLDPLVALLIVALSLEPGAVKGVEAKEGQPLLAQPLSLHRILCWTPMQVFGQRSYSVYILSSPVHRLVQTLGGFSDAQLGTFPFWSVYWGSLLASAVLLFHFVEDALRIPPTPRVATERGAAGGSEMSESIIHLAPLTDQRPASPGKSAASNAGVKGMFLNEH